MLESTRFLKNYILDSYNPKFKELPQNSLLAVFPEFKFLIQKNLPHLLEVPLDIKIKGVQLENKFTTDQLRYAYGYREENIGSNIKPLVDWPSNEKLIIEVSKWYRNFPETVDLLENKRKSQLNLGFLFDTLTSCRNELRKDFDFTKDWHLKIKNSHLIYKRFIEVEKYHKENLDANLDELKTIFNLFPFHPQSTKILKQILRKEKSHEVLLTFQILAGQNFGELINELNQKVNYPDSSLDNKMLLSTRNELIQLFTINSQTTLQTHLDFDLFRETFLSCGLYNISDTYSDNETNDFLSCIELFKNGGDLIQIQNLALSSIKESPRHHESWNMLGRTLSLQGFHNIAIPCFHQAITLGAGSLTRANLSNSYHSLNLKSLSFGMALSTLFQKDCGKWEEEVACNILGIPTLN